MRHSPCALTRRLTSTHCITTQNTDFFQVGDYSDGKKAAATQQTKTVDTDEVRRRRQRSARLGAEGCSERARLLATSLNRRTERSNGSYKIHRKGGKHMSPVPRRPSVARRSRRYITRPAITVTGLEAMTPTSIPKSAALPAHGPLKLPGHPRPGGRRWDEPHVLGPAAESWGGGMGVEAGRRDAQRCAAPIGGTWLVCRQQSSFIQLHQKVLSDVKIDCT